jgi:hypothetical protein
VEVVREGFLRDQFHGDHFNDPGIADFDGGTKCA